jgi:hypothetical protein
MGARRWQDDSVRPIWEPRDRAREWVILHPRWVLALNSLMVGLVLARWLPLWAPIALLALGQLTAPRYQRRCLRAYETWKAHHTDRYPEPRSSGR